MTASQTLAQRKSIGGDMSSAISLLSPLAAENSSPGRTPPPTTEESSFQIDDADDGDTTDCVRVMVRPSGSVTTALCDLYRI